jgi:hypothetical protein
LRSFLAADIQEFPRERLKAWRLRRVVVGGVDQHDGCGCLADRSKDALAEFVRGSPRVSAGTKGDFGTDGGVAIARERIVEMVGGDQLVVQVLPRFLPFGRLFALE